MHFLRRLYATCVVAATLWVLLGVRTPAMVRDTVAIETWLAVLAVAAGGGISGTRAWRVFRHLVTMLHEIGHAVVAIMLGGRVQHIVFHPDSSGHAAYALPGTFGSLRRVFVAGAGYLAPAIAAVAAVRAADGAIAFVWLLTCGAFAAGALVALVRNWWGCAYTSGCAIVAYVLRDALDGPAAPVAAHLLAGLLAVGAVRGALVQITANAPPSSDAATVGQILHLPARFVAWAQLVCCAALGGVVVGSAVGVL